MLHCNPDCSLAYGLAVAMSQLDMPVCESKLDYTVQFLPQLAENHSISSAKPASSCVHLDFAILLFEGL
jgi:hypothetical protein